MKRLPLSITALLGCLLLPNAFPQPAKAPDTLNKLVGGLFHEKKYDEAIVLLTPAIDSAKKAGDWESFGEYTHSLIQILYAQEAYSKASKQVEQAISNMNKAGAGEILSAAKLWTWMAVLHKKEEQFGATLAAYQTSINIFEKNNYNGSGLAYAYLNASQVLMRYSNDRQAKAYLEMALRSDTTRARNADIYAQLSSSHFFMDSILQAEKYYLAGMAEKTKTPSALSQLQSAGADIFLKKGDLVKAQELSLAALAYYQTIKRKADQRLRSLSTLAEIAALQNKPREAESYFQKAEAEGKSFYTGKSREMAKLYVETGLFYEENGQLDRALACFQKALTQAFPNFNSLNINDNPPVEDAGLESQAMRAAASKANLLLKMSQGLTSNLSATHRLNAAHCFDLSFAVAARLRRTYGNDADKFALAANNRDNYTAAALNLWKLWRETADAAMLARLFAFLEQTKAQALGDALQQQRALALTGIPDTLIAREENLRLEAAAAAKDLKEQELSGDSTKVVRLKDHAFRQEKAYADFLSALELQHPQFRQYTQAGIAANLPDIQSVLPDSTALLSWYDAGDRYLCVAVRRGGLSAYEVPRDSALDGMLFRFLGTLADKSRQETDPASYLSEAHFLFQKLLPETAISGARSLIIIPDGRLAYLPFEALLTATHTGNYANAPYLLRSKTVQYAWSATLLTLPAAKEAGENGLLQIAPFVESARDGLAPLPNSRRDAPASVGATVLDGSEATADAFLNRAPRHNALHLSTHADAGGRGVPGIEFHDRRLTLSEIYAQRFHASLVSLSACETGSGQFAEGEGVLSLARAFAYAGAQSLVASHWAVNERSTAELFSAFYKNLENGLSKAEALRQAKLAYLASPELDARKTPFHWAAFTLTGTDGPVELGQRNWWKWLFGAGGLLALLAFGYRGMRK